MKALRNLRTQPWFSLMVIGMLALGIAGNGAIFSIFNSLFLRPLPFRDATIGRSAPHSRGRLKRNGPVLPSLNLGARYSVNAPHGIRTVNPPAAQP